MYLATFFLIGQFALPVLLGLAVVFGVSTMIDSKSNIDNEQVEKLKKRRNLNNNE